MEVMFDRVAGLDVGKESVTVCVRTPGGAGSAQRDADVQDDDRIVAGDAGLAGRGRGDDRGDGVDLDVLEAAVLLPRRGHGGVAAERRAHEGGAGPQDRCAGCGVDRAAVGARAVGAVVRAAAGDSPAADVDPLPGAADGGPAPGHRPAGVDVGGRLDQVVLGRVESEDGVGAGDAGGDDRRGARPGRAGRAGRRADAAQDPGAGAGVDRALRRPSRPAGPVDAAPAGSGGAGVG